MEFTVTGMGMEILDGSAKPRIDLSNRIKGALRDVLRPMAVPGLQAVHAVWIYPARKRAPPPAVLDVRYSLPKQTVTCRFMMSPEVSADDPTWPAYRVRYVRQAQAMVQSLLESIEQRLRQHHESASLQPAMTAAARVLGDIAQEYETETCTDLPGSCPSAASAPMPRAARKKVAAVPKRAPRGTKRKAAGSL